MKVIPFYAVIAIWLLEKMMIIKFVTVAMMLEFIKINVSKNT